MTTSIPAVWKVGNVILDQYEVIEELGQGGMGIVHKVHHRGWNVDLAVKSLLPELLTRASNMDLFVREAETWVNLPLHSNIVSCYYVRVLGGIPRLFAECVAGGSLRDWIRDNRLYEGRHEQALARILDVAIQFAWGLHAAHVHGLVHQDVKPGNVMMTLDGSAKIGDFGVAKFRAMSDSLASQGEGKGRSLLVSYGGMTLPYCSPEQAVRQPLNRKTDIWSWGLSILQMFAGGVTWGLGSTAAKALSDYLKRGPQEKSIPAMPEALAQLLFRCFQSQPNIAHQPC